ncbi:MAG: hypothetical protein JW791_04335 [Nanoarchaeota archaeon]|nr:hypothetical protein [Nanoarchaeota archaeon]
MSFKSVLDLDFLMMDLSLVYETNSVCREEILYAGGKKIIETHYTVEGKMFQLKENDKGFILKSSDSVIKVDNLLEAVKRVYLKINWKRFKNQITSAGFDWEEFYKEVKIKKHMIKKEEI